MLEYELHLINSKDDLNKMAKDGWRFTGAQLRSGHWVFEREKKASSLAKKKLAKDK